MEILSREKIKEEQTDPRKTSQGRRMIGSFSNDDVAGKKNGT